jgi:outer membrane protein OmpA-like peptidoglycan-associated protein
LDYLMTRLEDFGQSGQPSQNRNQHNLRYAAGLMFTFGGERPSPPPPPAPPRIKQCAGGVTVPIDQDCPRQNISLGILANPSQICQGATASVAPSGPLPEGALVQWTINGEPTSQAQRLEFGSTGRDPNAYKIGLKATAEGYNDASAETTISVLGYVPPSGTASVSPSEIWLGEKATLAASFSPGRCGGALGPATFSAPEGMINGNQYDSANVQFAPPTSSEQRRTISIVAKVSDERGSGFAQANIVVKQKALVSATQLPDVLFAQRSDRVNNCGKRVLLEQLRTLANSDPMGRVVLVGHIEEAERASQDLDLRRALNAAAVISAGQGVCTAFPASQILVNAAGATDNGGSYQPNFCRASTAVGERPGQAVADNDDAAKYRRVEVWFVPAGGAVPASGDGAKDAAARGVSSLGCPR